MFVRIIIVKSQEDATLEAAPKHRAALLRRPTGSDALTRGRDFSTLLDRVLAEQLSRFDSNFDETSG